MAENGAGARIRTRRGERGLSQADLARQAGISASYLNLIEHGRRRVGGAVLDRIAAALGGDSAVLANGADAAVLQALAQAAARVGADTERPDRFAADFPGWADLIATQSQRIETLEAQVAAMADRMAYDPALSASVHDVLSIVTAIRSTAAILNTDGPLGQEWQDRFHRNIHEDSRRLAASAQGLAAYLTADPDSSKVMTPGEEVEAWLAARDHVVDGSETPDAGLGAQGRAALDLHLARVRADVAVLDAAALAEAFEATGGDPLATIDVLGAEPDVVLRGIARLPSAVAGPVGLVECDGAGAILHTRPIEGFDLPRTGAACALWPLFQAMMTPERVRGDMIKQAGRDARAVVACSVARLGRSGGVTRPMTLRATMLLLPAPPGTDVAPTLGSTCRLCPLPDCGARRAPAIL